MRTVADEVFAAYGMRRAIAAEVGGIEAAAAFVRAGVGIAILPAYAIAPHGDFAPDSPVTQLLLVPSRLPT